MAEEEGVEISAKTVDEAIQIALKELNLSLDQVSTQILDSGRSGLLGFGGASARVLVAPLKDDQREEETRIDQGETGKDQGPETITSVADIQEVISSDVEVAVDCLRELLDLMKIDADVTPRPPETPGDGVGRVSAVLDISGNDLGVLIGRRGSTLASLQYLVNLMLSRRFNGDLLVSIDAAHYKRRREESLRGLAIRVAAQVKDSGQVVALEPMPAAERRIVHLTLADDAEIVTSSIGEGDSRKVSISLRRRPPPAPRSRF